MIKLKSLKLKNIGRFVELQEIFFDKLGNLIQVDAQNNLTGGSSGSGKSTIFNALDWLLGLSDLSTTVLQSRLTKESLSVEGKFDWDGREVVIHRAKKLSVTVDGVETVGSSKLAEEKIDEILGMTRNLFRQILHKRQGDQGFFLAQTPAQMNTFLTDCLNLGEIRSKIDLIDLKTKDLTTQKAQYESSLQASEAALAANKTALEAIGEEPVIDVTETLVRGWKDQYESNKNKLTELQTVHKNEKLELDKTKPELISHPFDCTRLDQLEKEIKAIENEINLELIEEKNRQADVNKTISTLQLETANKISALKLEHSNKLSEFKNTVTDLTNIINVGKKSKELALELAAKIKIQREGICHTCEQSWVTEKAKLEEQKLLTELLQHKTNIEGISVASNDLEIVKTSITLLTNVLNNDITELNERMNAKLAVLIELAKPKENNEKLIPLNTKLKALKEAKLLEQAKEKHHVAHQNTNNNEIMSRFFEEQKVLTTKQQEQLQVMNKELEESRSQYERLNSEFKNHEVSLTNYKRVLKNLTDGRDGMNSKLVDINSKLVDTKEKLEIAEEVKRCLKSYLSCSFDDALDSVSESATRILRSVPTMANATVRLIGQKETGSGAIKDQVNALLDNDGEIDINIKSLSGGERSALDLSIDLAVCEMIQERANKGIDIMILDEPFNGFDSTGIEHALEILKTFSMDKKVLFVEHDSIAKEMVTDKITVIRDGETSYIQNNA